MNRLGLGLIVLVLGMVGCATLNVIPGTKVSDTKANREILDICERYRHAMEERDATTLLALAHPNYYEDSGTPLGGDDYGYDGLKDVLTKRLSALKTLRYNIEYRRVDINGHHAQIDIRYDATFQLATEMGDRWERKQNDKRLELENDGKRWLFIAGM
ncbi:MAG: putative secreted protein [Myxococcales bacterium]|nr:putative secreted protein [Myxococcales bacterium]